MKKLEEQASRMKDNRGVFTDSVLHDVCPTEGETSWIIGHRDDNVEEIAQSDGETAKKLRINSSGLHEDVHGAVENNTFIQPCSL